MCSMLISMYNCTAITSIYMLQSIRTVVSIQGIKDYRCLQYFDTVDWVTGTTVIKQLRHPQDLSRATFLGRQLC